MNQLERIRQEVEEMTEYSTWWGDYPVGDIKFLLSLIDEMLTTWRPPPEEDSD